MGVEFLMGLGVPLGLADVDVALGVVDCAIVFDVACLDLWRCLDEDSLRGF